ncbi:MAG: formate dehydrogenase accessory sulfurtransferase FdhD, partial [bacterium]
IRRLEAPDEERRRALEVLARFEEREGYAPIWQRHWAEDVGRVLLSTGRISSEMLRKGARMMTPFIVSRTSPTSLAVESAKRLGITLIGYVRNRAFNVYSHPQRIDYRRPQKRGSVVRVIETAHESGSG